MTVQPYGAELGWRPETPRIRVSRLLLLWIVGAIAVAVAAWMLPGVDLHEPAGAFLVALAVALFNAVLPPLLALFRLLEPREQVAV